MLHVVTLNRHRVLVSKTGFGFKNRFPFKAERKTGANCATAKPLLRPISDHKIINIPIKNEKTKYRFLLENCSIFFKRNSERSKNL